MQIVSRIKRSREIKVINGFFSLPESIAKVKVSFSDHGGVNCLFRPLVYAFLIFLTCQ